MSIATEEAFGIVLVEPGVRDIPLTSIPSEESIPFPLVAPGNYDITVPSIVSEEAFGAVNVIHLIQTTGIGTEEVFTNPAITTGVVDVSPISIVSEEVVNSPIVRHVLILFVPSIISGEIVSSPVIVIEDQGCFFTLMDQDLDCIFDTDDEFTDKVDAIYTHCFDGSTENLRVIFDNEFIEVTGDSYAPYNSRRPVITCKDRFKRKPTQEDMILIRGKNYQVLTYEPDGTGVAMLTLTLAKTN